MNLPFYVPGDDDGHFYAVAQCAFVQNQTDQSIPVQVGFYFSPSEEFSTYSFHVWNEAGENTAYFSGPDYSDTVEAAIIDAWSGIGVPVFSWRLVPTPTDAQFQSAEHHRFYNRARNKFCVAICGPRLRNSSLESNDVDPLFSPPPAGLSPINAFDDTEENNEILSASIENEA